tara:strand:- start:33 stop:191 length:159 start_codon:yes stop_codon:yes gene_type:complete
MKRKTRKELEVQVQELKVQLASYNTLFGMYVDFKGDSQSFQDHLKVKLNKNG